MTGKFVIAKAKNDGIYFNLVAANGEIIATSEVYESKTNAQNGIESVRTNCVAGIEDQTVDGYAIASRLQTARLSQAAKATPQSRAFRTALSQSKQTLPLPKSWTKRRSKITSA